MEGHPQPNMPAASVLLLIPSLMSFEIRLKPGGDYSASSKGSYEHKQLARHWYWISLKAIASKALFFCFLPTWVFNM